MRILVLGGTLFLGRAVVSQALAQGHAVSLFHRGRTGSRADGAVPPEVTEILGDRETEEGLTALGAGEYDVVVDTCGYVPAVVARSAGRLAGRAARYVFVSSVNAYTAWPGVADWWLGEEWDGDPDAEGEAAPAGLDAGDLYGWRKVGAERAVARAFGPGAVILRPGAIVGPYDAAVGRLPWWIDRVARGGEVLVPGHPTDQISLVDARDIARFALVAPGGVHTLTGPSGRDTRGDLLDACAAATGAVAEPAYVEEEWLAARGVTPWTEVPLWAPAADAPGVFTGDSEEAARNGMTWRPLAETVADTWAWMRALPQPWAPTAATHGLAAERERDLLAAWHAR